MRLPVAAFIIMCLIAAPALAQTTQVSGDWQARCDASGYCVATNGPADGAAQLRIGRHATEIYWEVSIATIAHVASPDQPFAIEVDGTPQEFTGPGQVGAYGSGTDFFFLGDSIQAVMDRLPSASSLTVRYTGVDGVAHDVDFSLDGLSAALIWIDEQQDRLGSERVAEAPPIGLSPVNAEAATLGQVPAAVMAMRDVDVDCRPIAEISNGEQIEIAELDPGKQLFILPCWDAAYNFGWKAYVEFGEDWYSAVALPELSETGDWSADTNLVNYSYDPTTRELRTFYKARGLGDCGNSGTYGWDEYRFRLIEFRSHQDCGTTLPDGLDGDFPIVFPVPVPAPAN